MERVVSLPPHIKIPSPEQKAAEPVVGSRKRKARKHSITHLLPAPPTPTQTNGRYRQGIVHIYKLDMFKSYIYKQKNI